VSQSILELWAVIKDANRDQKLPQGVLPQLLQRLSPSCIASFVRFARYDSFKDADESEIDYEHMRTGQQDILVDMYCVAAGGSEANQILGMLYENLQRAEISKDWFGVEAAWFGFLGVAEALADEPDLPEVFQMVLQTIFRAEVCSERPCTTAASLLRCCGPHFERSLQQLLPASVRWLLQIVQQIPVLASDALQELCGYAGKHLMPYVEELLQLVVSAVPVLPAEVDVALHGALMGIVRNFPDEQAAAGYMKLCEGSTLALASGCSVGEQRGRETLHRCISRFLRCTRLLEEREDCLPQLPLGQSSKASLLASTCLSRALQVQWAVLSASIQQLICAAPVSKEALKGKPMFEYSDVALQVNMLALLRRAGKAAADGCERNIELGMQLVEIAVVCSKSGHLAPLSGIAVLAGNSEAAQKCVEPSMDHLLQAMVDKTRANVAPEDVLPFLELVASIATSTENIILQHARLLPIIQLCMLTIRSSDQDVLKPALQLLLKVLMSRAQGLSAEMISNIIKTIFETFHMWPRSMSGQTFKLFSAIAERHEAIFVQIVNSQAIPSVAGLPSP